MFKEWRKIKFYVFNKKNFSFLKKTKEENSELKLNQNYDISNHSLKKYMYLFKFNQDNIGYILHEPQTKRLIGIDFGEFDISFKIDKFSLSLIFSKFVTYGVNLSLSVKNFPIISSLNISNIFSLHLARLNSEILSVSSTKRFLTCFEYSRQFFVCIFR